MKSKWIVDDFGDNILEVEFHTGGWSGAETVIGKLLSHHGLRMLYYQKWESGGHYWFHIPAGQLTGTKFTPTP